MSFCKHRIMDKCRKDNRPCIFSDECFEPEEIKQKTNADRIRSMSDEEMVVFLDGFSSRCIDCAGDAKNRSCPIYKEGHYCRPKDIMEWLKQPAEEADNE